MPRKPKRSKSPSDVTQSKVLLVEGQSPKNFFIAAAKHLGINDTIDIHDFGGVTQLTDYLETLAAMSSFQEKVKSIGIARDAEDDPVAALEAVKAAVRQAGISPEVSVATFIFPDRVSKGNIETLCLRSVEGRSVTACVQAFVKCSEENGAIVWAEGYKRDKALVQIYAATLESPEAYAGLAAYEGAWPWDSPALVAVLEFLQSI